MNAEPRTARPPTPYELGVAIHEAAHCVFAWYFGYRVLSAWTHPHESTDGSAGEFWLDNWDDSNTDWPDENPENYACIFLAGNAAHHFIPRSGLDWSVSGMDLEQVRRCALNPKRLQKVVARTDRLVTKLWPWIELLAAQLLRSRKMDHSQVHALLNDELNRRRKLNGESPYAPRQ